MKTRENAETRLVNLKQKAKINSRNKINNKTEGNSMITKIFTEGSQNLTQYFLYFEHVFYREEKEIIAQNADSLLKIIRKIKREFH